MQDVLDRLKAALAERYRVEREIGAGGMATVYLAEDLKHHRQVAIKVLRPELAAVMGAERFLREIEIAARLQHPHILPLYDSGDADGLLYYVMPFVEGESLRQRLDREKQLPIDDALQIAREVGDALSFAHSHDVIHRDIKPDNIMLAAGHAVVSDFGIARAVTAAGGDRLTETGTSIGTPVYMSPEQAAGSQDLDGRSDLYSLGCVLHEMLAGEPPFTGVTVEAVIQQHLTAEPPTITSIRPAVPGEIVNVLARALAKTPADRFSPVGQFVEAIGRSAQSPAPIRTDTLPTPTRRVGRWAALAGALGVVAITVLLLTTPWRAGRATADKSIAVLPLENLSGDQENAFFAAGVHEEILTYLGKVRDLRVISRSSVMQYGDRPTSARDVARELGVAYVLEGSVRRAANEVRVTVQLIDARTDEQLWANNFDGQLADVFAIQSTIAQEIVRALRARLSPEEQQRLADRPTESIEAYDLFLRARASGHRAGLSLDVQRETERLLEQAVAVDPEFALAYAELGEARAATYWFSADRTPERLAAAKEAIDRAFQLQPNLPEAHFALASYYYRGFYDYPRAFEQLEIARQGFPGSTNILHLMGLTLRRLGRWNESVDAFEEATQLDPANLGSKGEWFWTSILARDWDRARIISDRLADKYPRNGTFAAYRAMMLTWGYGDTAAARLELAQADESDEFYYAYGRMETALFGRRPTDALGVVRTHARHFDLVVTGAADVYAAQALLARSDTAEARSTLDRALRRLEAERAKPYASTYMWPHVMAGVAYALAGNRPRAREACARAQQVLPESKDKVHGVDRSTFCALVLGLIGDTDSALSEIERLLQTPNGFTPWQLALDPSWDFLRSDPRFQALLAQREN